MKVCDGRKQTKARSVHLRGEVQHFVRLTVVLAELQLQQHRQIDIVCHCEPGFMLAANYTVMFTCSIKHKPHHPTQTDAELALLRPSDRSHSSHGIPDASSTSQLQLHQHSSDRSHSSHSIPDAPWSHSSHGITDVSCTSQSQLHQQIVDQRQTRTWVCQRHSDHPQRVSLR